MRAFVDEALSREQQAQIEALEAQVVQEHAIAAETARNGSAAAHPESMIQRL